MFVLRINSIERNTATYEVGEGWAKVTVVDRVKYRESENLFPMGMVRDIHERQESVLQVCVD